jgi:glycosyltransferase involved in cell wall biosynthesis
MRRSMPPLAISFLPQSNIALLLAKNAGTRCVVVERNDFERQPLGGLRTLQKRVYPLADALMANSQSTCAQLSKTFPDQVVRFLPNIYPDFVKNGVPRSFSKNIFVVGRLVSQKKPVESLRCFVRTGLGELGWVMWFVGGGELEDSLRAEAAQSSALGHSVRVLGEVRQESIPYDDAGFLLLNSDYEGAPNVLAEALERGIIPIFRNSVAQAAEIVPADLLDRFSFSSEDGLEETLKQLPELESDFSEISGRLHGYYLDQLRNYKLLRQDVLAAVIRDSFAPDSVSSPLLQKDS